MSPSMRVLAGWIAGALALVPIGAAPARAGGPPGPELSVSFDSEWIRLSIAGDSLEVRGTYVLRCREKSGERISLFYPFPEDSLLGGARMISLSARIDGRELGGIPWMPSHGVPGVRWNTPPCTGDTLTLDTLYRQKLTTNYARYIVTTTKAWLRPLRLARFEVRLPAGAVPIDFSFPFEARGEPPDRFYTFEARDFLPDHDVIFRWKSDGTE